MVQFGFIMCGFGSAVGLGVDQLWFHVLWTDCIGFSFGSAVVQPWFGSVESSDLISLHG